MMGYVHIYCGEGKGKTTAAAGLAVRMAGSGGHAVIVRFLKNDDSGEVSALRQIRGITVLPCRKSFGFTWQMTEEEKGEAADYCREQLHHAFCEAEKLCGGKTAAMPEKEEPEKEKPETEGGPENPAAVLLVLDEICAAVNSGLLPVDAVLEYLDKRPENLEVVMTGRRPPKEFEDRADYISEIIKQRHPFDRGIGARKGIEY